MEQFMKEEFDFKRFFLLNIKRIWIVILGAVLGASLFAGVYTLYRNITDKEVYRSDGIYGIEFDMELYGDTIQYYNDYTWNDVIDSDIIGGKVAERLGVDKSTVYAATFVPTMSDIRIIHVYVDSEDKELAAEIQNEMIKSLEEFAISTPGFNAIDNWSIDDIYVIKKDFLIKRVTIAGLIIGLVLGVLYLFYYNAMDDSVYTLKDVEKYAGAVLSGYASKKQTFELADSKNTAVCVMYKTEHLSDTCMNCLKSLNINEQLCKKDEPDFYKKLKAVDSVIAFVKYGNHDGNVLYSEFNNLRNMGVKVTAVIVADEDDSFVRGYYGNCE